MGNTELWTLKNHRKIMKEQKIERRLSVKIKRIFEILPFIIGIVISGFLTIQFGYLTYILNFSGSVGYSFSIGMVGDGAVAKYISENMPVVFLTLFILMATVTVFLSKRFIRTLKMK